MSVWTRLFGRSKSSQPTSNPRLGLESLEKREVPAIVFVGGWGASMYQYAHTDPAPSTLPSITDLIVDPYNPGRTADASDYSAVVFVGGWGGSPATGDVLPTDQFSMNYGKIKYDAVPMKDSLTVPEPRPEPIVTIEYLTLGTFLVSDGTAGLGRDVLISGPSTDTTALAPASDYLLEIDGIKGISAPVGPSGKLTTDPAKPDRDASPLPVLMVIADRQDFYSTIGTGRDVLIADLSGDREDTSRLTPSSARGDGWSGTNYFTNDYSLTVAVPRPDPEIVLVLEDTFIGASSSATGGTGRDVLIADQTGNQQATSGTAADDVWVDGKVITGENYESPTIANSGYIRIKKLNSGG